MERRPIYKISRDRCSVKPPALQLKDKAKGEPAAPARPCARRPEGQVLLALTTGPNVSQVAPLKRDNTPCSIG